NPPDAHAPLGPDPNLRAQRVAPERRVEGADRQPVPPLRGDVAEYAGRPGDGRDQQVLGAVAVEVSPRHATADVVPPAERRVVRRDVPEAPRAVVGEELVAVRVLRPERAERVLPGGRPA